MFDRHCGNMKQQTVAFWLCQWNYCCFEWRFLELLSSSTKFCFRRTVRVAQNQKAIAVVMRLYDGNCAGIWTRPQRAEFVFCVWFTYLYKPCLRRSVIEHHFEQAIEIFAWYIFFRSDVRENFKFGVLPFPYWEDGYKERVKWSSTAAAASPRGYSGYSYDVGSLCCTLDGLVSSYVTSFPVVSGPRPPPDSLELRPDKAHESWPKDAPGDKYRSAYIRDDTPLNFCEPKNHFHPWS